MQVEIRGCAARRTALTSRDQPEDRGSLVLGQEACALGGGLAQRVHRGGVGALEGLVGGGGALVGPILAGAFLEVWGAPLQAWVHLHLRYVAILQQASEIATFPRRSGEAKTTKVALQPDFQGLSPQV
jgi:hypothetical protein